MDMNRESESESWVNLKFIYRPGGSGAAPQRHRYFGVSVDADIIPASFLLLPVHTERPGICFQLLVVVVALDVVVVVVVVSVVVVGLDVVVVVDLVVVLTLNVVESVRLGMGVGLAVFEQISSVHLKTPEPQVFATSTATSWSM